MSKQKPMKLPKYKSLSKTKPTNKFSRWLRNPKAISLSFFVLAFMGIGAYKLFYASAATVIPHQTYTNWTWKAPSGGFTNMKHRLVIESVTPNSTYFWSHQFHFINGDGGYIGLQSHGYPISGGTGKTAIFSIFGAGMEATPGRCVVEQANFDGYDKAGSRCIVPYEWVQGRMYQLRTKRMTSDSKSSLWAGYVKDMVTGKENMIGQIRVPGTWKGNGNWSVMWTEYFGKPVATCAEMPYSRARFYRPNANSGSVYPVSSSTFLTTNSNCRTSKITRYPYGINGYYIQEMGNPALKP